MSRSTQRGRREGLPVLPWGLTGLVTVPLGIVALVTYLRVHPPIIFGDIGYYSSALRALTGDAPLYDPASLQPHVLPPPPFWDQAPSTAIFSGFLLLPGAEWIWGLGLAACVIAAVAILMPPLGGGVVMYAPVMMALPPVVESLAWGNLSALVLLMLAVAIRWPRHAGWAIGLAAAAKVVPVLGVAWLVGRRDWRNAIVALAIPGVMTLVAVLLTAPSVVVDFVIVRLNHSPPPDVVRWGLADFGVPLVVTWVVAFGVAALSVRFASFSLAVIAMLLASPGLHMHQIAVILVPALAIWLPGIARPRRAASTSASSPQAR